MAYLIGEYEETGGDFTYLFRLNLSRGNFAVEEASNAGRTFSKAFSAIIEHYVDRENRFPGHEDEIELRLKGEFPLEDRRVLESFVKMHELVCGRAFPTGVR